MSRQLEHLGLAIKTIQWRHHRALDSQLLPLGISLVQWNALREINRNPGCSAHRLSELTFNSAQAFGTLLTRLQQLGFVERLPGPGRANTHRLTPGGKAMLAKGQEVLHGVLSASFASLSREERATLSQLLDKLLAQPLDSAG